MGLPCTIASPDRGVPQQVCMLLLVTLRRANVLARLSLDRVGAPGEGASEGGYALGLAAHKALLGQQYIGASRCAASLWRFAFRGTGILSTTLQSTCTMPKWW